MKVNKTVELAGTHCWLADWRFTLYSRSVVYMSLLRDDLAKMRPYSNDNKPSFRIAVWRSH